MTGGQELEGRLLAGRYRVVRLLGAGGMGAVFEAVQEDLGRRVALKVLRSELASDAELMARFRREAQAAACLSHPHVVNVTDFQANAGEPPFLVMEYVEGRTVRQLVAAEGPLAPARAARIASQVLEALEAAHASGIVHRDVKPDNVVVAASATFPDLAKLLDFGIAKVTRESTATGPATLSGVVLGTMRYMAPEQAQGAVVDARADLYSVAATIYFAVCGRPPIDGPDPSALVRAVLLEDPPLLSRLRPDIDATFEAIVARGLRKTPAERFPSASAMRGALGEWLASPAAAASAPPPGTIVLPGRSNPPPPPPPPPTAHAPPPPQPGHPLHGSFARPLRPSTSPRSSRGLAFALGGGAIAALLLAAGVVAVLLYARRSSPEQGPIAAATARPPAASPSASTVSSAPAPPPTTSAPQPTTPTATASTKPRAGGPSAPSAATAQRPPAEPLGRATSVHSCGSVDASGAYDPAFAFAKIRPQRDHAMTCWMAKSSLVPLHKNLVVTLVVDPGGRVADVGVLGVSADAVVPDAFRSCLARFYGTLVFGSPARGGGARISWCDRGD